MVINWMMLAIFIFPFAAAAVIYLWMKRNQRIIQTEIAKDCEESRRRFEQAVEARQAQGEVDNPPKELTPEEYDQKMKEAGWVVMSPGEWIYPMPKRDKDK